MTFGTSVTTVTLGEFRIACRCRATRREPRKQHPLLASAESMVARLMMVIPAVLAVLLLLANHLRRPAAADRSRARLGWQVMAWEYTKTLLLGAAERLLGAQHSGEEGLRHEDSEDCNPGVPKRTTAAKAKAKAKAKTARRERDRRRRRRRGRNKG